MSTLGKVLAILNVLAAIAFFALAAMDYGQRKKWMHNVYVHDLAIQGLPVDAEEPDTDGIPQASRFNEDASKDELLKEVFKSSGTPVRTQEDEVNRVHDRIMQKVKDANDATLKGTELQKLATALIPFADSASRRDALARLSQAPEADVAKLPPGVYEPIFGPKFVEELNKPENADKTGFIMTQLQAQFDAIFAEVKKKHSPEEKKQVIAAILIDAAPLLDDQTAFDATQDPLASPAFNRTVTVIGMTTAVREIEQRAAELQQIVEDVRAGIDRDRSSFAAAYQRGLYDLMALSKAVEERKSFLVAQKALASDHEVVVNQRKTELTELQARLAQAKTRTDQELAKQTATEKDVFDAQRRLRDASNRNQSLESDIRKLEQGR